MTTPDADPIFLSVEEVLGLHDDQLRLFGGSSGLRDRRALDLFHMAAAYAFHIAENQPFVDGNKRTGLNAALVFLDLNGWVVTDPQMRLYDAMLALSARQLDKNGLASLFRVLSEALPSAE